MVKSKKLLSLFLAVVMVFSVFTVMASAFTMGAEVSGNINYKFTVEKVDEASMADGSSTYTGDDIYAVTLWMQCDAPVTLFKVPLQYDKNHYTPFMIIDGADLYMGNDTYYTDMEDDSCAVYSYGAYMNNTGMYKANGDSASKALAKCIGLGNANSGGPGEAIKLYSPDHDLYSEWHAGLADNIGVMKLECDVTGVAKSAYLNTISGITADTGWNEMITVYFQRNDGVTDADCAGDIFGVTTADSFGVDGITDASGNGYYVGASTAIVGNPNKNIVSNAVVEEAKDPSPVFNKNSQIRFNAAPVGDAKADFDVRTRGYIAADALEALCGGSVTEDAITDIGFVFFAGEDIDLATAAEVAKNGSTGAYTRKQCSYVQATGSEYVWTCMVTDPAYDGTLQSVAYITVGGETYITDAAQETSFADLYDRNIDSYLGA